MESASNISNQMPPSEVKNRNEYQKQIYQANREKLLARRRQLYAENESRREKDKEYYLKIKGTPEYKKRTQEASLKYYYKNRKRETEEDKRTRYREVGKLLAGRKKAKPVYKSWIEEIIPDLSQSYGSVAYRGEQSQGVLALLLN